MEIDKLYKLYDLHPEICIDTRKIIRGCIFFSLKGDNFNGNQFAHSALDNGAAYAVIDELEYDTDNRCILVENVLVCLQNLANYHRHQLKIPVISLTGSNGKTTTKELCRDVLAKKYRVEATMGNLNNHIGVPLTILNARRDTEILLVEMGANHQGEIDALCTIANPDYVMITNIGKAHLEGFGGLEGIKKGKSEMYRYATMHQKKIFINTDDDTLISLLPPKAETIRYSASELIEIIAEEPYLTIKYKSQTLKTKLYGAYNQPNIAFAVAAGQYFHIGDDDISEAIRSYTPENNRSQIVGKGSNTFIKDAYNANPSSMKLSIESFNKLRAENKVLILGDMLELGDHADEEHRQIIKLTQNLGFEKVIFIGRLFNSVALPNFGKYFTDIKDAKEYFDDQNYKNSTIFLKGSRGIAVEKLISD